jgi:hypothetical protein
MFPQRVPKFPTCSPKSSQVPDMFPKEFPIVPHFGKCCPPFTYIGGPKGGTWYFKIEPSVMRSLHSFFFFFGVMGQSNWLIAKTKLKLEGTLSN